MTFLRLMPLKWWLTLAVLALCAFGVGYARYDAVRDERDRVGKITDKRKEDISDAINDADDCADWRKCLHAR
tara:strand:- start:2079 stop:2294 length:216 start_codon:yes stop_codon:yes gene_type:complete